MSHPAGLIHVSNKPGPACRLVLQETPSWSVDQMFSNICLLGYHHSSAHAASCGRSFHRITFPLLPNSWCSGWHRARHLGPPIALITGLSHERISTVIYILMGPLNQGFKLQDVSCTLRTHSSTKHKRQTTFVDDVILHSFIEFRLSWLSAAKLYTGILPSYHNGGPIVHTQEESEMMALRLKTLGASSDCSVS